MLSEGRKDVEYIYPASKCVLTLPSLLEIFALGKSAQQMRRAINLNSSDIYEMEETIEQIFTSLSKILHK